MQDQIQYCTASDGVRLAYSVIGKGTPVVRVAHWFTHLEYDLKTPVFRHILLGLAHQHTLLRYDSRGTGLSQREVEALSFDRWVSDLEAIVDHAGLDRFVLVGLSQGAPIGVAYAVRHPHRVSKLILYGGYARGLLHRDNVEKQQKALELNRALVRSGWGSDEESYRQFFTSQLIPDSTIELHRTLNALARAAATPEMAERQLVELANVNVSELLPKVTVPTLVLHARKDLRVPFALGQEMAAGIPGAKFVPLAGSNHITVANEPAHREMFSAIASFLGDKPFGRTLPGTATAKKRLDDSLASFERNWLIKLIAILAGFAGLFAFLVEVWRWTRP
jgi:pimeloyl-ACP methyl ester carboxylesterase